MFELFSDILSCRDSFLSRLEPRVKLVAAAALLAALVLARTLALPLLVVALCLAAILALRLPAKMMLARMLAPVGMVAVLLMLQLFIRGKTPLFSFTLGSWTLVATREGLACGLLIGARVLASVSVLLLLSAVTPAHKIFHSLRWFRVPAGWVEIAMLMYRYIFALIDQTADVVEAQKVRLGYAGAGRSLASMGTLAGTILIRSVDQSLRTHEAMRLRGYTGEMPFGPLPKLRAKEYALMLLVPLALAGLHFMLKGCAL